ncbi:MAG TPA: fructosamine kinase family protein [Gammaproteobacteria bacterium]|nr:fructosamine kinase family protein [Gammaproteobacteria bacterium]
MSASQAAIEQLLREASKDDDCKWQSGGWCVGGSSWRVTCGDCIWFVKTQADALELFNAEADGLKALAEAGAIRVPKVLGTGEGGGEAFLVLEWLELGRKTGQTAARLGEALARQHQCLSARFGWRRNNFIGATPQFNACSDDWLKFFREHRLGFQLRLVAENGFRGQLQTQGTLLLERLPTFFEGYIPKPSLLHGDLWGGNWGVSETGEPVIFDPAVYYGDREVDFAMTELFGGFPPEFHSAYNAVWPLDDGYQVRRNVYNLYHVLNHLNLFGTSYLTQAQVLMEQLLTQV